ncbi:MAG: tRNA lysidine(34) synthetase TilS, partial [Chloroflexota bacterium]
EGLQSKPMSGSVLVESVYKTLLRRNLLPASAYLIVGVSGGTDSLALLHILLTLRDRLAIHLHVATLDHGLRGDAGADDARFVETTAHSWGLLVTAGYVDVRALAHEQQIGIEAAARIARYDFLAGVADAFHATLIAVAHNADDQVETVLFHLLRGSSLTGLGGMSYISTLPGHLNRTLIRPLLDIPRADLDAYCREHDLHPRHDVSNDDTTYTRNRLRRETLPYLREISPQVARNLRQLADIARLEDDFADIALHQAIDAHVTRSERQIRLPNEIFFSLHSALQRRFIVWALHALNIQLEVDYRRVIAAVEIAERGKRGARAQFNNGLQLRVEYQSVSIEFDDTLNVADLPLLTSADALSVTIHGSTPINPNWSLTVAQSPFEQSGLLAIREESKIIVRVRQPGDYFAPLGLGGHTQKISKWMIDHKVPAHLRDHLPLFVVDDQIAALWWQGWIISEKFAVTPSSSRIIYIGFHKKFRSL